MLSPEEIRERLKDRNIAKVAYYSGLSYGSVLRLSKGHDNPKYETVKKVSEYLEREK